ncbi:hypothetical protein PQ478_12585 [Alkalihalophilus pseudofirmus]|uniref:hypothetical protein n=1 Tax=Alkalihalophilus pseudofirmus TaxID=79885 RepID=UPI00259BC40E|nr:hypothetical protein [Alkalihalophilus pseudofirmus]WEG15376.1 hypothetical protein PQ478_12585 [Alkalihalophilus pseudofirmus]
MKMDPKEKMSYHKKTNTQLQHIIIHLKSELKASQVKLKEYEENYHYSQLKQLKIENKELNHELSLLIEEIENLKNLAKDAESQITLEKDLNKQLNEQLSLKDDQVDELAVRIDELNMSNLQLQTKQKESEKIVDELKKQITSLTAVNNELQNQVQNAATQLDKKNTQERALQANMLKLKNELKKAATLEERSREQTSHLKEVFQQLQEKNNLLEHERNNLETELKESKKRTEIQQRSKIKWQQKSKKSEEVTGNLKREISKYVQRIHNLEKQLETIQASHQNEKNQLLSQQMTLSKKMNHSYLNNLRERLAYYEGQLKESQLLAEKMESEFQVLKQELSELRRKDRLK